MPGRCANSGTCSRTEPSSPLYDGSHPIRALHTLVAIESRFGDATACAA